MWDAGLLRTLKQAFVENCVEGAVGVVQHRLANAHESFGFIQGACRSIVRKNVEPDASLAVCASDVESAAKQRSGDSLSLESGEGAKNVNDRRLVVTGLYTPRRRFVSDCAMVIHHERPCQLFVALAYDKAAAFKGAAKELVAWMRFLSQSGSKAECFMSSTISS